MGESMGIKDVRSNIKHGRYSRALVLPANLKIGEKSTIAANRLILVDPRAEIKEDDLLQFLEEYVEPQFWSWRKLRSKERLGSKV